MIEQRLKTGRSSRGHTENQFRAYEKWTCPLFPLIEVARPKLTEWGRNEDWHKAVNQPLSMVNLDSLRQSVMRGTPQGQPPWIADLTSKHGMESTVRSRGRPSKLSSKK